MKKTELETMIREVVRKECKTALYEALTELFGSTQPKQQTIVSKPKIKESVQPNPVVEIKKTFTKNPILNSILNETANDPATYSRLKAMSSGTSVPSGEGVDISSLPGMENISFNDIAQDINEGMEFSVGKMPEITPTFQKQSNPATTKMAEIFKKSLELSKSKQGF